MTDPALMLKLLFFLVTLLVSARASDDPPLVVTNAPSAPSNSTAPTQAPTVTAAPSAPDLCSNTPGFEVTEWNKFHREWHLQTLGCDDILVDCFEYGNLGPAKDHCCKCRPECAGQCSELVFTEPEPRNQDDSTSGTMFFMLFIPGACFVGLCVLFGLYLLRRKEQRIAREIMAARQLANERRENNGLTEQENENVRFEQFVTKFYFQNVSEDKSNISAESIRSSNTHRKEDEETPTEKSSSFDDSDASGNAAPQQSPPSARNIISEQLSNWIQPSTKHECCICLDAYVTGETICAPANKSCNHVFHESCIKQWLKKNDHCPLCRTRLLAD